MTTAANLTVVRRSIVGDASSIDHLEIYCKDASATNAMISAKLVIPNPTAADKSTYVNGYTFTPTLAAPAAPAAQSSTAAPASSTPASS